MQTPPSRQFAPHRVRGDVDIHILSYPKAGRTWLRALIGKALVDHHALPESMLLDTPALTRAAGLATVAFDHDQSAMLAGLRRQNLDPDRSGYRGARVLLLGRDVRDILVSAYFQATRRINVFSGSISAFIHNDAYGVEKVLAFYRIWSANRHVPAQFMFLTYEDMHRDPAGSLVRVLAFMDVGMSTATIEAAVDYCRFDNMRAAEAEDRFGTEILRAAELGDPEAFKVRVGKVGNFAQYMSSEDVAYIDAAVAARGCEFTLPAGTP